MLIEYRKIILQISQNNIQMYQKTVDIRNNNLRTTGGLFSLHKQNNLYKQNNSHKQNNEKLSINKTEITQPMINKEQLNILAIYSKKLTDSLLISERKMNDLTTIFINGQLITCTNNFRNEFNKYKITINNAKDNIANIPRKIKNIIITFAKKTITEFSKAITSIISYITQICANPLDLLIKWLSKPNTIIELGKTSIVTGFKNTVNTVNIINPKKFIHNFLQNNSQMSISVIITFYNSIIYSPILNKIKKAINNVINSIINDLSFIKPYVNNIKDVINTIFSLINAQKLKEILKQCTDIILNQHVKDVFSLLKQIFSNYVEIVKNCICSFMTNIQNTFKNLSNLCLNIDKIDTLNIDENKFNEMIKKINDISNKNDITNNKE